MSTLQYNKKVFIRDLMQQLKPLPIFKAVTVRDNEVTIELHRDPTSTEKQTIDDIVNGHVSVDIVANKRIVIADSKDIVEVRVYGPPEVNTVTLTVSGTPLEPKKLRGGLATYELAFTGTFARKVWLGVVEYPHRPVLLEMDYEE